MNLMHDIPPGTKDEMNVIIEIPRKSRNKYEYDKDLAIFALDRVLYSPFHYAADYGFIPQTLCDDGDALDGFVIIDEPTYPGILIKSRAVGVMRMTDSGEEDNKLICVPVDDGKYKDVHDIKDLPDNFLKEIKHFMEHYKDLQKGPGLITVTGFGGREDALKEFEASKKMYKDSLKKK